MSTERKTSRTFGTVSDAVVTPAAGRCDYAKLAAAIPTPIALRKENPVLSGFRTMARYNRWMNERVYERCEKLPDAERKTDRGAFFRSIHGTLNHLLLGDRLWLSRFLSREFRVSTLADELYADFAELRRERAKTDAERSEEHTSELQSRLHLVCRLLLEKNTKNSSS